MKYIKKGMGRYASFAVVILISLTMPLIVFQVLEKEPETPDITAPRKVGVIFEIDSINRNVIYIRNIGIRDVDDLKFYIGNKEIQYTGPPYVTPGKVEAFTLNIEQLRIFPYPNILSASAGGLIKSKEVDFSGL